MKKNDLVVSGFYLKWRKLYAGSQCTHKFYDVLMRGGPKITYEVVSKSERRCEGIIEVSIVTSCDKEWRRHEELVWKKRHGDEYRREAKRVVVSCPVCGQSFSSNFFRDEEWYRHDDDDDEIPF